MNGTSIILKKELKRVFGDKKLVFSLFILPAILMIALYGLMGFMSGAMSSDIEEHKNVIYIVMKCYFCVTRERRSYYVCVVY